MGFNKEGSEATEIACVAVASIQDLSPEVMSMILVYLLNEERTVLLRHRLVNSQWRDIINFLLGNRMLYGVVKPFSVLKLIATNTSGPPLVLKPYFNLPQEGVNSLPFNSTYFKGSNYDHARPETSMLLPEFVTSFATNLTLLQIEDVIIHFKYFTGMLNSLSSLKRLSLTNLMIKDNMWKNCDAILHKVPPLPSLRSLELVSFRTSDEVQNSNTEVLYVWLVASFADQLGRLELRTHFSFPALEISQPFTCAFNGNTITIASTSQSAYGKLKELTINYATIQFLQLSQLPALKQLSIIGLDDNMILQDFTKYIERFKSTLEKLYLDIHVMSFDRRESWTLPRAMFPHLHTFIFPFPENNLHFQVYLREAFLSIFPQLRQLQLLYYSRSENRLSNNNRGLEFEEDETIIDFKTRELLFQQQLASCMAQHDATNQRLNELQVRLHAIRIENSLVSKQELENLEADIEDARRTMRSAFGDHVQLQNEMAGCGIRALLRRFMEREGIWNDCPRLETLSVSSAGKPTGDVALRRRRR